MNRIRTFILIAAVILAASLASMMIPAFGAGTSIFPFSSPFLIAHVAIAAALLIEAVLHWKQAKYADNRRSHKAIAMLCMTAALLTITATGPEMLVVPEVTSA
ncbi:MAG: hypothetical protein AABZ73_02940 [Pseudomonadota bacterium]|uniref:hypothetical protein n=1 Tax=Sphingobium sp. TaxID=1912891 RepID=UPI002E24B898